MEENNEIVNNKEETKENKIINVLRKNFFYIGLGVCGVLVIMCLSLYTTNYNLEKKVATLNKDNKTMRSGYKKYKDLEANYENLKKKYDITKKDKESVEGKLKETQSQQQQAKRDEQESALSSVLTPEEQQQLKALEEVNKKAQEQIYNSAKKAKEFCDELGITD